MKIEQVELIIDNESPFGTNTPTFRIRGRRHGRMSLRATIDLDGAPELDMGGFEPSDEEQELVLAAIGASEAFKQAIDNMNKARGA